MTFKEIGMLTNRLAKEKRTEEVNKSTNVGVVPVLAVRFLGKEDLALVFLICPSLR